MSEQFHELYVCIEEYIENSLNQGQTLFAVIDRFRDDPLPQEVIKCGSPPIVIRRAAQHVATSYLLREQDQKSAELPAHDLIQPAN